jgi:hypothetical protein
MRKKLLVISGLFALVGTIAVAAVLGTAGIGKAASPNICLTASTTNTNASCVAELTAPHVLTAGGDGVSVTRFTNQSNLGGATATHVVLSATFLDGAVTVKGVTLFVNGSQVSTTSCSTGSPPIPLATPVDTDTVSCPVGAIVGGSSAKLVVRFSVPTAGRTVAGSASYGEGGNDSTPPRPNGSKNDLQTSRDSFTIAGTSAQGSCFPAGTTVSGSTATQVTTASVGAVDPSLDLPCTPAGAGVAVGPLPAGFVSSIWFTDFLAVDPSAGGFATVTLDALFNVPKSFVLKELTGTNWTAVPACNGSGLPPSGDSCIFSTSNLPKGGVRWILHAYGTAFDSKYAG